MRVKIPELFVAAFVVAVFLSSAVSSQQIECSKIAGPSGQGDCSVGSCRAGVCTYFRYPSLTHVSGYCSCVTVSSSTTTTQPPCYYERKTGGCLGDCRKGYVCLPAGQYECSCQTTTTTLPYSCYYDTGLSKCVGTCRGGLSCVEVAARQCACSMSQTTTTQRQVTTTTRRTTTSTTLHLWTAGDLLKNLTFSTTTTLKYVTATTPTVVAAVPWALLDDDNDSVMNGNDDCQGTPQGTAVFDDGCGCVETDNGMTPYEKGSCKQTVPKQTTTTVKGSPGLPAAPSLQKSAAAMALEDRCLNNATLLEYYCNESQRRASRNVTCPIGCAEGACVCNDGDGGLVYNETGVFTIKLGGGGGSGSSSSGGHVTTLGGQMVVLQGTPYASQLSQPSNVLATVGIPMGDYCVSDTVLKEFYCDGNGSIRSLNHVCSDACQDGRCVAVPNVNLLFVPVNWNGNQASFNTAVQTQTDFFVNAIPLKDCPDEIRIVKLNLTDGMSAADFDCYTGSVQSHVDGLGINRADYDVVVGLTNRKTCGNIVGRSNGADTVWVYSGYDSVGAHELGHIYGLADQYCSNQAGSSDGRCNDGDVQGDGAATGDYNYLDASGPYNCPPNGGTDSNGKNCCNFYDDLYNHKWINCTGTSYSICCLGNRHTAGGGRSIMSFADVDVFTPGARAFDGHDKAHLATVPQLKCGNTMLMYLPLLQLVMSDTSTLSDESEAAEPGEPEDSGAAVGYSSNLSTGKVVIVDLNVSKEGKVSENEVTLRDGRPTMKPSVSGDYHLMAVDRGGGELWSALFDLYFDYEGPVEFGKDYSDVQYMSRQVSYRIPYFPQMREVRLYHNGREIYRKTLDFCVADGVCDAATENAQTCPADCRQTTQTTQKASGEGGTSCIPLLLAPLAALASLAAKTRL